MNHVSRRDFLKLGAAGAAMGFGLPLVRAAEEAAKKKIPIGVQLYSVREQAAKDLPGVLEALAKMGYKGVEFAGYYNHPAKDIRKMLDANGLVCCGTHAQWASMQPDPLSATVDFNKTIGNKYLIVPWMEKAGKEEWLKRAAYYNELADKLKGEKMLCGYHAHAHDFESVGGQSAWDVFFGNTKKDVVMQLDTGNCLDGKADPVAVLKKYPGRAVTIHLKEWGGAPTAALGEGEVKWNEVFAQCEKDGVTEWYIVEHEKNIKTALDDIKKCLENLKKMGKV